MGKTLISLTTAQHCINHSNTLQVVIVCPKPAVSSFKKELTKKLEQPYSIYTATEYNIVDDARYHIFCYSKLSYLEEWIEQNKDKPKLLIIDEVHKMNSSKTKTYKTLAAMRKDFNVVIGLTATPLMNEISELYYVINFIKPGFLGTRKKFEEDYLIQKLETKYFYGKKIKQKVIVGYKNLEHLTERLKAIMIGGQKTYNLDFQYRSIGLTENEGANYNKCAKGLMNEVFETKTASARLIDLQYVLDGCHPEFPQASLVSKEKLLITVIKEILDRNESVLIYVGFINTLNRLKSMLNAASNILKFTNVFEITGSVKLEERVKLENELPRGSIVLMTSAGTASINLQKANNIIVYDTPWSLGDLLQLIGRITRIDTKYDTQHIYFLEVEGTIDTYKRKTIESKVGLIQSIFGKQENLPDIPDEPIDLKELRKYLLWRRGKKQT